MPGSTLSGVARAGTALLPPRAGTGLGHLPAAVPRPDQGQVAGGRAAYRPHRRSGSARSASWLSTVTELEIKGLGIAFDRKLGLGKALALAGRLPEAGRVLGELVSAEPHDTATWLDALWWRAWVWRLMGRAEDAAGDLAAASRMLLPDDVSAAAATRSTALSWTCPRRSRPSNAGQPSGRLKINGDLVISIDNRLSFDALQRRLVTSPAKARQLVAVVPASYVAFDLLAIGGIDLRTQRWSVRRGRLEQLAAAWSPPLQLSPVTRDLEEAREWFEVLPAALGVEGLIVKARARGTSAPGASG
jgi:hypothetical protein